MFLSYHVSINLIVYIHVFEIKSVVVVVFQLVTRVSNAENRGSGLYVQTVCMFF